MVPPFQQISIYAPLICHFSWRLSCRTKEFEIMKGVCHPNLVQALDYFQHPCGSALVLSYIPSVTLTAAVRSKTHKNTASTTFLSEGKAKSLFRMLLDALSYLHHRRIIHSDAWCIDKLAVLYLESVQLHTSQRYIHDVTSVFE